MGRLFEGLIVSYAWNFFSFQDIQACSAATGDGLYDGLDWLTDAYNTMLTCGKTDREQEVTSGYMWKGWEIFKKIFSQ